MMSDKVIETDRRGLLQNVAAAMIHWHAPNRWAVSFFQNSQTLRELFASVHAPKNNVDLFLYAF